MAFLNDVGLARLWERMKEWVTSQGYSTGSGNDFANNKVTFNSNGSITEVGDNGTLTTTFNSDGSITQTRVKDGVTTTLKTTFNSDGTIDEVVS